MRISDWSSDVCSSDLDYPGAGPQSNAAQGIFDQVVADLKQAIFAIANHRRPAVEGIATCLRQGAIRRQSLHLGLQPWPQGSQLREGQLLANPASLIGRRSLDIPFDREQFADPHDRFSRYRRWVLFKYIGELAPRVRPAAHLDHAARCLRLGVMI